MNKEDSPISDLGISENIDAVCRGFEEALKRGNSNEIGSYVESWSGRPGFELLGAELLKLEIEHRLKNGLVSDDWLSHRLVCQVPGLSKSHVYDVIVHEATVRWLGGENWSLDSILRMVKGNGRALKSRLEQAIVKTTPSCVTLLVNNSEMMHTSIRGDVVAGRQSRSEPAPFSIVPYGNHLKLVIAANGVRHISRQQVHLSLAGFAQLNLTNEGTSLPLLIDANTELPPHASIKLNANTLVEFEEYAMRVLINGQR